MRRARSAARVRLFQQIRRSPATGQARLSRNWMMRWTAAGETVVESTHTPDRAAAERVAQVRGAELAQAERDRRPGAPPGPR